MHAQCNARLFSMKELNFQPLGIGIVISGKKGYLTIGKDVVKKLNMPTHASILINKSKTAIAVIPCHEREILSFKVPDGLMDDHHKSFTRYSKEFVEDVLQTNSLDKNKTYHIAGTFDEKFEIAVFPITFSSKSLLLS